MQIPAFTAKEIAEYEAKWKNEVVTWLQRKFGREAINDEENARGRDEIIAAIKNPDIKVSSVALLRAMEQEDCSRAEGFFGCPCEGDPIHKCPHSHAFYAVQPIYDKGGVIIGIKTGGSLCQKYRVAADEFLEQKAREEKAKKQGWWGKDPTDYEQRRKNLIKDEGDEE